MEKSSAHFKCFESNPPLPTMRRWMVCGHPIQQYAKFNSFFPTESHWFPLQPRASCCPNVHLDLGHSRLWSARSELVAVWHVCLANGNQFVIFKWITHLQDVGWIERCPKSDRFRKTLTRIPLSNLVGMLSSFALVNGLSIALQRSGGRYSDVSCGQRCFFYLRHGPTLRCIRHRWLLSDLWTLCRFWRPSRFPFWQVLFSSGLTQNRRTGTPELLGSYPNLRIFTPKFSS